MRTLVRGVFRSPFLALPPVTSLGAGATSRDGLLTVIGKGPWLHVEPLALLNPKPYIRHQPGRAFQVLLRPL